MEKLNNSETPVLEDYLSFPIRPLRAIPTAHPRKQIRNTNNGSGNRLVLIFLISNASNSGYFSHFSALSRTFDLTNNSSLPNSPNRPPALIQQFINNSLKFKNKEHKYNRSQPDYFDQ